VKVDTLGAAAFAPSAANYINERLRTISVRAQAGDLTAAWLHRRLPQGRWLNDKERLDSEKVAFNFHRK